MLKFNPFLNFEITRVFLIIFFSSMGTAIFDVFIQLLIEIWEIEKLEFQLLDALMKNCAIAHSYSFCSAFD